MNDNRNSYSFSIMYGSLVWNHVPKLCDALKQDFPEYSNEDIKARVLKEMNEQMTVMFSEEAIQSCWPDWITSSR